MAFFEDLSEYEYFAQRCRPGSKNVGWLERGHTFEKAKPSIETLDLLWSFCTVNVMQARGFHICDLCDDDQRPLVHAERNGLRLSLGSAEIRVFSSNGTCYAAPKLVYHYVRWHDYKPPGVFLRALEDGPRPIGPEYINLLRENRVDWKLARPASPDITASRFERVNGVAKRMPVELPFHLDAD
jgi:hypothetical protein